jgi:hypothetical protein
MKIERLLRALPNVAALTAVGALEFACSAPAEEKENQATVEQTGEVKEAFSTPTEFTWNQNQGHDTVMWSYNSGYCYLTGVTGRFRGQGEMVRVTVSNGTWLLTGSSGQVGVGGWARCVPWSDFPNYRGAGFGWDMSVFNQGNCAANGTCGGQKIWGADSFCSLSGVQGRLMGPSSLTSDDQYAANGDAAQVVFNTAQAPNSWWEDSGDYPENLLGWQPTITAWAQCLNLRQNHNMWFTGIWYWYYNAAPLDLGPTSDRICAITGITGYFNGGGEYVYIGTIGGDWVIYGGSGTGTALGATVQCLFLSQ